MVIRASSELAAVFRRLLGAFEARDGRILRSLTSPSDKTLLLGSDPKEWQHGAEAIEVVAAQVEGMPEYRHDVHRLEAWEGGSVGWAAADATAVFESGQKVLLRVTAVFHLEDGVWKLVQWHASEPKPNDPDVMGAELTDSLSKLMDAISEETEDAALRAKLRTNTITLLFSDIEESTRLAVEMGDIAWGKLISNHLSELKRITEELKGVVVKTLGDGAMMAFDSARNGVGAAVEIMRSSQSHESDHAIKVRVGVHTGDAIETDGDYFGQMVDKTARIAAASRPGQILISAAARELVSNSPDLEFEDPISLDLKGIPGPVSVYPVRT